MPAPSTISTAQESQKIRLSEVLSALSIALDITEGQPEGHAVRSCWIGMRIADALQLSDEQSHALFYALLLKDLGCSSNAAKMCWLYQADDIQIKQELKQVDWTSKTKMAPFLARRVASMQSTLQRAKKLLPTLLHGQRDGRSLIKIRCERGADIVRMLGFPELSAQAILDLDEHWNGQGNPLGRKGEEISLLGRICGLAQTAEIFFASHGIEGACEMAQQRAGTWFDPALVKVLLSLRHEQPFWEALLAPDLHLQLNTREPEDLIMLANEESLDRIATAFAQIVDAKSPWTYRHSEGVAAIATGMAEVMGFSQAEQRSIHRAGLLHDIGKLGISNLILDKPGRLTEEEFAQMKQHTAYTQHILERVEVFRALADVASAHHEKLNGRGYHRGLVAEQLPLEARILAVADICEALSASRPYREDMPKEKVLSILQKEAGTALCEESLTALYEYDTRAHCIGCHQEQRENIAEQLAAVQQ